jgi:hypothetical protein
VSVPASQKETGIPSRAFCPAAAGPHERTKKKKTGLILLMWLGGARSCDFIRSTKKVHNIGTMIDWWIHFFLSIIALIFFQQVFSVVGLAEKMINV